MCVRRDHIPEYIYSLRDERTLACSDGNASDADRLATPTAAQTQGELREGEHEAVPYPEHVSNADIIKQPPHWACVFLCGPCSIFYHERCSNACILNTLLGPCGTIHGLCCWEPKLLPKDPENADQVSKCTRMQHQNLATFFGPDPKE